MPVKRLRQPEVGHPRTIAPESAAAKMCQGQDLPYDFYRTARGSSPNTTTHPTYSSNMKFNNFYPFVDIETISPRPMLFVTGDSAHSREFSEEAYKLAGEPKELVVVANAGHVDLYDRVDLIPFDKLTRFFQANL